jgi:hypothetical protein
MTVSRLVFRLLYPLCCADTKVILGSMDIRTGEIRRCINARIKQAVYRDVGRPTGGDFVKWLDILERGTFNPVERIAIKAALYDHKREATRKLIYSTLVDGEVVK